MRIKGKAKRYHALSEMSSSGTNIQTHISPWIPLWWSAALPGFGHFLLGINLTAYVLVIFEFIVNYMAHINDAIYFSMLGDFEGAKHVINLRWFFGYIGIYMFAMYDSYRRAVDQNKLFLLAYRYTQNTSASELTNLNRNFMDVTSPGLGLIWSFITPGTGAIFVTRTPIFIFAMTYWGITAVFSHWFEGIYYTAIGDFEQARNVLQPAWFLFIPSIITFSMYFGYHDTVKENKAFKLSQARYLKDNYQSKAFKKPV
ncbi:hypothetical protein ACE3NQ_16425 [Paenibacillus terreus]|uniref:Uncharacterized protein n=2 Tax=Paenibacillus terreus TaxID=1387834 RepID=A0ABV5B9Z3_9BACL